MITNSRIAWGNSLGAQLTTLASLLYCGMRNNQDVVFFNELRFFRRGLQFLDVFDIDDLLILTRFGERTSSFINTVCLTSKNNIDKDWKKEMRRIYNSHIGKVIDILIYKIVLSRYKDFYKLDSFKDGLRIDPELLLLDKQKNYDILQGFGTYRDYEANAGDILRRFHFKNEIVNKGLKILNSLPNDKKLVSVHFRLTDYLLLSSLNLESDYYIKAMKMFNKDDYRFVVFSDDLEKTKTMSFLHDYDVSFLSSGEPGVDLFLMTKCNGNIIANSSFSLWGALLNEKKDKRVVCPHDFVGASAKEYLYLNGNYYPCDWIAI